MQMTNRGAFATERLILLGFEKFYLSNEVFKIWASWKTFLWSVNSKAQRPSLFVAEESVYSNRSERISLQIRLKIRPLWRFRTPSVRLWRQSQSAQPEIVVVARSRTCRSKCNIGRLHSKFASFNLQGWALEMGGADSAHREAPRSGVRHGITTPSDCFFLIFSDMYEFFLLDCGMIM